MNTDELMVLLKEMRGDYEVALGVARAAFADYLAGDRDNLGASTWTRHCRRRIQQLDTAIDAAREQNK